MDESVVLARFTLKQKGPIPTCLGSGWKDLLLYTQYLCHNHFKLGCIIMLNLQVSVEQVAVQAIAAAATLLSVQLPSGLPFWHSSMDVKDRPSCFVLYAAPCGSF